MSLPTPYRIEGPALVSVSGGRTSGFMLRQIINAHGGTLPPDVVPVFCNTGREHEATLAFLHELETRWCPIVWLEYTNEKAQDDGSRMVVLNVMGQGERAVPDDRIKLRHTFRVVDYCSAARNGEPFAALLAAKRMLPNPVTRFCTSELKIRTGNRYARSLGWEAWDRIVGLRADEPRRVARIKGDVSAEDVACPMADAGHTLEDVQAFWTAQPFDLQLPGDDDAFGNCDLCFLKGRSKLEKVMQTAPERAAWWIAQEERDDLAAHGNGRFWRIDRPTYRQMQTQLTVQGRLLDDAIEDDTLPCMCTD